MEFDLSDLFDDESIESVENRIDVERVVADLPARERQILYLFACGHTQEEIGETVGLCQQRISQILANISKKSLPLGSK